MPNPQEIFLDGWQCPVQLNRVRLEQNRRPVREVDRDANLVEMLRIDNGPRGRPILNVLFVRDDVLESGVRGS